MLYGVLKNVVEFRDRILFGVLEENNRIRVGL